jgi:hypothetical protein
VTNNCFAGWPLNCRTSFFTRFLPSVSLAASLSFFFVCFPLLVCWLCALLAHSGYLSFFDTLHAQIHPAHTYTHTLLENSVTNMITTKLHRNSTTKGSPLFSTVLYHSYRRKLLFHADFVFVFIYLAQFETLPLLLIPPLLFVFYVSDFILLLLVFFFFS